MKRTLLYTVCFMLLGAFASCDIIKENDRYIEVEGGATERVQRVLIEEFTGRKCVNCPDGAVIVHDLQNYYPGQVVAIAIHAGVMAPPPIGKFLGEPDFQTDAGDEYNDYFDVHSNPAALINRMRFTGEDWAVTNKDKWMTYTISALDREPVCELTPTCQYDAATRMLTITTEAEAFQNMPADLVLGVALTESHIIGKQEMHNNVLKVDYEHNHVFREAVNGTWGENFPSLMAGETTTFTHSIELYEEFVPENCHVVVYVFENATKQVLQCNECAVIAE